MIVSFCCSHRVKNLRKDPTYKAVIDRSTPPARLQIAVSFPSKNMSTAIFVKLKEETAKGKCPMGSAAMEIPLVNAAGVRSANTSKCRRPSTPTPRRSGHSVVRTHVQTSSCGFQRQMFNTGCVGVRLPPGLMRRRRRWASLVQRLSAELLVLNTMCTRSAAESCCP